MHATTQYAAPVGRILISLIFIVSGLNKITTYAGTQEFMNSMEVPGVLLPLVILLEVVGGLMVLVGWQTRWAALALAVFCILSAFLFHMDFANQIQFIMFMKNIAIAGGFLFLVAHGAGALSFDQRRQSPAMTANVA